MFDLFGHHPAPDTMYAKFTAKQTVVNLLYMVLGVTKLSLIITHGLLTAKKQSKSIYKNIRYI